MLYKPHTACVLCILNNLLDEALTSVLAEVCVCVLWWVLQTGAGEGVEKVEGPSPRGEGGEGERGL